MSVPTAGAPAQGTLRYQLESGLERLNPAERAARGKEARAAVPRRFVGASKYANMGQRVVAGQRLMHASDIFLGWQRTEAGLDGQQRDFYVRHQLRDWKYSVNIETLVPRGMRIYGELCGWTPARVHARSADRIAIAAYLGGSDVFDQAITRFAAAYADQNERAHKSLVDIVASGPDHRRTRPVRPPLAQVARPSAVLTGVHRGGGLRGVRRWPRAPERRANRRDSRSGGALAGCGSSSGSPGASHEVMRSSRVRGRYAWQASPMAWPGGAAVCRTERAARAGHG